MSVGGLTGCPGSEIQGGIWCRGVGGKRGGGHLEGREEIVGWSTESLYINNSPTNRYIKGLCVGEEGGRKKYYNWNTGIILLQHELLVWVEVEEREKLFNCGADVLRLDHHHIASTVAVKVKLQFLFRSTYN